MPAAAAEQVIRDPQVIGVVGAVRSDAALTSLPLFNAAGILLVSPGAGYPGFTEPVAAGEPDRWFPSGRDTFARMIEDDIAQADAMLRAAGRGRVAIEGEVGKVASEQVEALQEAGGDRIVEDVRRADAVIYAGSDVRSARASPSRSTREAPWATLVFGDELTRAGLPGRLAAPRGGARCSSPRRRSRARRPSCASSRQAFEEAFGRTPDPYAVLAWRATTGILDAIRAAGRRANLRRVVVEGFLADRRRPEPFTRVPATRRAGVP